MLDGVFGQPAWHAVKVVNVLWMGHTSRMPSLLIGPATGAGAAKVLVAARSRMLRVERGSEKIIFDV